MIPHGHVFRPLHPPFPNIASRQNRDSIFMAAAVSSSWTKLSFSLFSCEAQFQHACCFFDYIPIYTTTSDNGTLYVVSATDRIATPIRFFLLQSGRNLLVTPCFPSWMWIQVLCLFFFHFFLCLNTDTIPRFLKSANRFLWNTHFGNAHRFNASPPNPPKNKK